MPNPVERLTLEELDALIAVTHADITWHNQAIGQRIWAAIDELLDQRNRMTNP